VRLGRPYVTMKVAVSLDGRIAAAPGVRTPITGPATARRVHRERAEVDAIAVGSGTILADDPLLTARGAYRHRPLVRVVYDRRLRTPPSARLFDTLDAGPVIIVCTAQSLKRAPAKADELRARGAELLVVDDDAGLRPSLEALSARGVTSLVVEDGAWRWVERAVLGSGGAVGQPAVPVGEGDTLLAGHVRGAG